MLLSEADLPDVHAGEFLLYERKLRLFDCDNCKKPYHRVTGNVERDDVTSAVYFANCHRHEDGPEIWIDVVLGSWGEGAPDDHLTLACRVGEVEVGKEGATLVDVQGFDSGSPLWGQVLTRAAALPHPCLPLFWSVVDLVLVHDPDVRNYRL